ncbi:MAG: NADH:flavin oxidoreductase/NADH oxidase [Cumulibacter sp.]
MSTQQQYRPVAADQGRRLFDPLTIRSVTFANRAWLSPMCQYSAEGGLPGDWHLAHLGARAAGGFGLVMAESTAVSPESRISLHDTGLWNDAQRQAWQRIVSFVHTRGAKIGIQLSHAGRKASIRRPWDADQGSLPAAHGGWRTTSVDDVPFPGLDAPRRLNLDDIAVIVDDFAAAARRADAAGFDVLEIQAGHGFLLHSFLSPLSNQREGRYGGSPQNRARLLFEVIDSARGVWPSDKPLFVRFSVTDWLADGLVPADITALTQQLHQHGVDLIDVSSGGLLPARPPISPSYHVPLADSIRNSGQFPVAVVGEIDSPQQAQKVIDSGSADAIFLGRAALRDPMWTLRAAHELDVTDRDWLWQPQYVRGNWT